MLILDDPSGYEDLVEGETFSPSEMAKEHKADEDGHHDSHESLLKAVSEASEPNGQSCPWKASKGELLHEDCQEKNVGHLRPQMTGPPAGNRFIRHCPLFPHSFVELEEQL